MRVLLVGDTPLIDRIAFSLAVFTNVLISRAPRVKLDVFNELRPDVVVNGIVQDGEDPSGFRVNSRDAATCALYSEMVGAKHFHLSDASVFSRRNAKATDEPYPTTVYGLSRALGERAVLTVNPGATIVRFGSLYGAEIPESQPMIAYSALVGDRKVAYVNNVQHVTPTFIGDAAAAVALHIVPYAWCDQNDEPIVHCSPELSCTWYEFLEHRFPEVRPHQTKTASYTRDGQPIQKKLSLAPTLGWFIPPGGLGRFMAELEAGKRIPFNGIGF